MKTLRRVVLSTLPLVVFAWSGFGQSTTITGTITTYAGGGPILGRQAITQAIGYPASAVPDGAGGFYFSSSSQQRIYRVAPDGTLTASAGTGIPGFSGDGGPATSAQLHCPAALALDGSGNLFIVDSWNYRVREITPDGMIHTVAGNGLQGFGGDGGPAISAQLYGPAGVAVDAFGDLFISDWGNHRVREVTPDSVIRTVAGNGTYGFSGDGGPATSAQLNYPTGLAVDGSGNLFISDPGNHRVRKVNTEGLISTVAGNGQFGYSGDGGSATSAQLSPGGIAVDGSGNLFIVDSGNNRIRKITPDGVIRTVAGNGQLGFGGDGDPATSARLWPTSVAVDESGNLFIAESLNNRVRKVTPDGVIRTVAGNGTDSFGGDGGPATAAQLSSPEGLAVDVAGNLFIVDTGNFRVRKVTPDGVIRTVAGNGTDGFSEEGVQATSSPLMPSRIAADRSGNIFIADTWVFIVRKVTPDGVIRTVAGGMRAFSDDETGVAVDESGNLFIANYGDRRVYKVTPDGASRTVAGTGESRFSGDDGPAASAQLAHPRDVAVDGSGNIFIVDADYDNNRVRKVTPDGVIRTVAGGGRESSGDGGPATSAQLSTGGVAVDGAGNLFISDPGNHRVRKVTTEGLISTVVGNGQFGYSGDGGSATAAQLGYPGGLAVDGAGNLFISDSGSDSIRKVTFAQQTSFSVRDRGGLSLRSAGTLSRTAVGYASIQPVKGSATPAGLAIFGFRQNNVLVTEASVPASPLMRSGRVYAEVDSSIYTGLAIANPNSEPATVSFFFTDSNGRNSGSGTTTISANGQIARFLNEPPFNGPSSWTGTFTFSSSALIAAIALRGRTNERSEFLITTLPVADLQAPASTDTAVVPHFADGGGWTTEITLVNPTDSVLTGAIQFFDSSGTPATVAVNNQSSTSFAYSMPARSYQKLPTSGAAPAIQSGSVRVVAAANTTAPYAMAVFSFRNGETTVTEAGVPAMPAGTAFRLYAEASETIQTGLAIANTSSDAVAVTLELSRIDGSSVGLTGTLSIPAGGHTAVFLNQVQGFGSLQTPFQGILRLSSATPVFVTGLRGHTNERGDFLIADIPPVSEAAMPPGAQLFFPQIADSGGYTTQFILFSAAPGSTSSGTMQLFNQSGGALGITLQ
jgi:sugar lactone lactonase YvrE